MKQGCDFMKPDPIVKEVREAGARLAAKAGHDVHRFFENFGEPKRSIASLVYENL